MTGDSSGLGSVSLVLGVLVAIPLFMMGVAMPLMALLGGGHGMGGAGGLQLLVPVIPLTLLGVLSYTLYKHYRENDERSRRTGDPLGELRSAYARGDLSDGEFETRRDRLRSHSNATDGSEATHHE